jgi:hypothetical protein
VVLTRPVVASWSVEQIHLLDGVMVFWLLQILNQTTKLKTQDFKTQH